MPTTTDIPADILDEIGAAEDLAASAATAVEVTDQLLNERTIERKEAQEAYDRADEAYAAALRAERTASQRVVSILKRNGIVQTADGYRRADECPACGAPVNAGRHMRAIDALNCDF